MIIFFFQNLWGFMLSMFTDPYLKCQLDIVNIIQYINMSFVYLKVGFDNQPTCPTINYAIDSVKYF